jgi:chromate reductase
MATGERLRVLGFAGSLREGSFNRGLLRAAIELAPDAMTLDVFDLGAIPLFNEDVERQGDPEAVTAFRAALAGADALLVASPEYNFGISGVLKNAIDWASRPPGKSVLSGKPTAIVGASPGPGATRLSQAMLRQVLTALAVPVLPSPLFMLAQSGDKFADGRLADERSRELLRRVLDGLVTWTTKLRPR